MRDLLLDIQPLTGTTSTDAMRIAVRLWFCLAAIDHVRPGRRADRREGAGKGAIAAQ